VTTRRNDDIGKLRAHPNRGKVRERYAKIKALRCKDDLDRMLRAGYPVPKIAKWLQEEMGEYTDVTPESLVSTLSRYRNDMPKADMMVARNPNVATRARKAVVEGLDELDELEGLYRDARERIKLGMRIERGRKKRGKQGAVPPMHNPKLTQDFAVALQILARRHDIKMDLGMQRGAQQQPGINLDPEVTEKLEQKYGPEVAAAMKSPESRAKVLSIVDQLKKRAAAKEAAEREAKAKREASDSDDIDEAMSSESG